ncbi:hypothetical protein RintRC_4711 [Richelia intracellularis]|nr:hypothetical protein RintRC_4711 [Richelia intracellularis]
MNYKIRCAYPAQAAATAPVQITNSALSSAAFNPRFAEG